MLLISSNIQLLPSTRLEQFCSFLEIYLTLMGWASLPSPRSGFVTFFRTAFPFLSENVERFREDDHD